MTRKTTIALALLLLSAPLAACEPDVETLGDKYGMPEEICLNVWSADPCPKQDDK